jgi:hypothetical protein
MGGMAAFGKQAGAESERQASAAYPSSVELTIKSTKQRYPKAFGGKKRRRAASVLKR